MITWVEDNFWNVTAALATFTFLILPMVLYATMSY